jgi:Rap1a immunity proteins
VFMDGNALYGECADNRPVYQGKCGGFVVGVRDTLSTLEGTGVVRRTICMPKAVTQQQAIDVARQFLTAHPELRHLSAASLVVGALQQSFPCTK